MARRQVEGIAAVRADAAPEYYEKHRALMLTTFDLPLTTTHGNEVAVDTKAIVSKMPFASFAVRQAFDYILPEGRGKGVETVLVTRSDDGTIELCSRIEFTEPRICSDYRNGPDVLVPVHQLYAALYGRTHRFMERGVSRQVKRAESRPPEYREYIVVPRDSPMYDKASRPSEIARRLRALHAVRRHPRRLPDGRVTWVKAHSRGSGTLLQVKDYRIQTAQGAQSA